MKKIIVDCQKRTEQILDMTPQEELLRLDDTQEENKRKQSENKKALLRASIELREMKQNPIFDVFDIATKQAEIDALQKALI